MTVKLYYSSIRDEFLIINVVVLSDAPIAQQKKYIYVFGKGFISNALSDASLLFLVRLGKSLRMPCCPCGCVRALH